MTNAISVKDRLKKQAIKDGKTMQDKLVTFGLERTIYRLSVSSYMQSPEPAITLELTANTVHKKQKSISQQWCTGNYKNSAKPPAFHLIQGMQL
jgi:hypothetical protein